jgi:hypothetical protein
MKREDIDKGLYLSFGFLVFKMTWWQGTVENEGCSSFHVPDKRNGLPSSPIFLSTIYLFSSLLNLPSSIFFTISFFDMT